MHPLHESPAPASLARRLRRAFGAWWRRLWADEMTAYLSQAENHVELEYRIRRWNERHPPLP